MEKQKKQPLFCEKCQKEDGKQPDHFIEIAEWATANVDNQGTQTGSGVDGQWYYECPKGHYVVFE